MAARAISTPRAALSVSAAHALHFQIPKLPAPTPPSLLKRQHSSGSASSANSSTSPRMRPASPSTSVSNVTATSSTSPRRVSGPPPITSSPPRAAVTRSLRSPPPPNISRRDTPRPASPSLPSIPPASDTPEAALGIEINEFEATFRTARPVAASAN